jgi:nucleoprotein TPR
MTNQLSLSPTTKHSKSDTMPLGKKWLRPHPNCRKLRRPWKRSGELGLPIRNCSKAQSLICPHQKGHRTATALLVKTKSSNKRREPKYVLPELVLPYFNHFYVQAAEQRYSQEVVAHAESIKMIEALKQDLQSIQASVREHKTAAETASAKLTSSEESWKQQRDALDKEVSDLNARCKELSSQNSILHNHLESVSTQAARIQSASVSAVPQVGEGDASDDVNTKLSELRSVVAYLRKEKEIVDLQLELSKQENVRLKSQIEHLTQTLEEVRTNLSEERQRAVENAASAAQHAELVERINQLNILRESNATLRSQSEAHAKRAAELDTKLKALSTQLEPLQEQARVSTAELEAKDAHIKRVEEEAKRWQERNAQLLSKAMIVDRNTIYLC